MEVKHSIYQALDVVIISMAQSNTEILQSSTKPSDVHYSDITCELWCFKSLATQLFAQQLIMTNDKDIKDAH